MYRVCMKHSVKADGDLREKLCQPRRLAVEQWKYFLSLVTLIKESSLLAASKYLNSGYILT